LSLWRDRGDLRMLPTATQKAECAEILVWVASGSGLGFSRLLEALCPTVPVDRTALNKLGDGPFRRDVLAAYGLGTLDLALAILIDEDQVIANILINTLVPARTQALLAT
jgi:hypothetical protein